MCSLCHGLCAAHCQKPCHPLNLVLEGAGGQDNLIALIHLEFLWLWGRSPCSVREGKHVNLQPKLKLQCKQLSEKQNLYFFSYYLVISWGIPLQNSEARAPTVMKINIKIIHCVHMHGMKVKIPTSDLSEGHEQIWSLQSTWLNAGTRLNIGSHIRTH